MFSDALSVGIMPELNTLNLWCNNIGDTGSVALAQAALHGALSKLTELDLSSNGITGAIPEGIGHLRALQELNIANNNLVGEIPLTHILQLPSLKLIDF